jgi:hypothetical protein
MTMMKIFGAKAKVLLRYDHDLKELTKVLSKGLILPDFTVEFREEHPFDLTASCEVLACQLWVNSTSTISNYNFILELETELSYNEISLNQMYDLSAWLARFISKICDIDAAVYDVNNSLVEFFNKEEQ